MSISINNTTMNKCIHISFILIICLINVCSLNAVNDKTINNRSFEETEPRLPLVDDPKYCFEEHYNTVIKAIEKKGIIGKDSDTDKENAKDNFFTITLPDYYTSKEYDVKLSYNLYGVKDANHTTKSINGETAYGGQLVQVNNTWNKVEEFIAPQSLKTGENEIFFTRRKDENYRYEIEDVSVTLIKKRANSVFLTENTLKNYNGKIQVMGYASEGIESVAILGETIQVENGIFEHFLDEFPETEEQLTLSFSTIEGEKTDKEISVAYISEGATFEFISKKNGDAVSINLLNANETYNFHALHIETPDEDILEKEATLLLEGLQFKDVIPLNMDVDAVASGKYLGYRLQLNTKNTEGDIKVHLKYDPSKIPSGYGPKDVRTFAYNRVKREWEVLVVDSLDVKNNVVISKYSGDTDYVNGVIKVPEMAETSSFTPTMIADMEYANPAAGIVNIAPPSANNTGTVSTGFPIKLPAGRNGMQPNLNISYNSEGGNGWMGLGWNLQLPAIALDTRWGVPRFDEVNETEIYQLNGEQLVLKVDGEYTSPHRTTEITRNGSGSNRVFYLRKEGAYLRIVRIGTSSSTYNWVVIDKYGNQSYYGGTAGSIVKDDTVAENIVQWLLRKTVDPFGNEVRYFYEKNTTTINGVSAQYFYPSSIEYTMTTGVSNPNYYQVDFTRENGNREDINLSARTGVLVTTNHELLSEINISFINNGTPEAIRSYKFDYINSVFKKKQLSKISEYDAAGQLFYSNTMEYYDDTEDNNDGIVSSSDVVYGSDEPNTSLVGLIYGIAPDNLELPLGSVLGTSTTSGFSAGLRVGLGLGPDVTKVNNSIGGSYNYSQNKEKSKISFLDINGDGLPDKVYKEEGDLKYMPNEGVEDGEGRFGAPRLISGISTLDETKTRTHGFGWDANVVVIGVGKSQSNTKTRTDGYFVDFNGDGLPDMVKDGTVKFNLAKSNSIYTGIEFDNGADQTENPIVGGGQLHSDIITNIQSELESLNELRANHSQFDHVQSWKAPYTGTITILGDAQLVIKNNCENENEDNKFRLTIEYASATQTEGVTTVLPNSEKELTEQNQTETYNLTNVSVQKGDVLFFRTHNVGYGCGGTVSWNPVVGYPNGSGVIGNAKDENEHTIYRFDAEENFIMNNGGGWTPNAEDVTASIAFNLADNSYGVHQFSDDVRFNVEKITYTHVQSGDNAGDVIEEETESQVWTYTYRSESENGTIDPSPMPSGFTNVQNQYATGGQYSYSYRFYVDSDSNVKWSDIHWKPQIAGNDSGTQYPAVSHEIYEDVVNQDFYWVNANTFVQPIIDAEIPGDEDKSLMTITHDLFNQEDYYPLIGSLEDEAFPIEIQWVVKQKIGAEARTLHKNSFYLHKEDCGAALNCNEFRDASGNIIDPTAQNYDEELSSFNLTKAEVQELKNNAGIVYSAFYINNKAFGIGNTANSYVQLHEDEEANYTYPVKIIRKPFIAKDPTFIGTTYRGWVPFLYNGGVQVSYTEEGEVVLDSNGQEATVHFDGNIDMGVFNPNLTQEEIDDIDDQLETDTSDDVDLNATVTRYTTYQQKNEHNYYTNGAIFNKPIDLDTVDPDSFNESNVIYGYNENNALVSSLGRFGEANLYDLYIDPSTGNQNFIGLELISKSVGKAKTLKVTLPLDEDNPTDGPSAGGSGTNSEGHSKTLNQYLDLNGDRYPDIVTEGTIQFTNMDGSLSDKTLDNDFTSGGKNKDVTSGVNIAGMSPNSSESDDNSKTKTSINSGINTGQGKAYDTRQWVDINGDGLPDKVTIGSSSITVRLNRGYNSFSNEIVWGNNYTNLKTSTRTNDSNGIGLGGDIDGLPENTSASFAFGFGAGNSTANGNAALIDVNGDGLPDLVIKTSGIFIFYLNTGTSFTSSAQYLYFGNQIDENYSLTGNVYGSFTYGFFFTIFGIQIKTTFTPTAGLNAGVNEKRVTIQDINGDGFPDIIEKGDDNTSVTAHMNSLKKTHKLKSVKNALGGNWTVDYTREGNTFDMPQSQWVLSTIATHDGFTEDTNFGTNETLTAVTYSGPYQDRRERDFIGFNKVTIEEQNPSNEAVFRESSQYYHTDNIYLKGALHSSSLKANGTLLSSTSTTYNIMNPEAPETNLYPTTGSEYLQSGLNATALDKSRLFVAPVKTVSTTYEDEGNESLSVEQHFTKYDGYGNLLTYINLGDTYTSAAPTDAYKTEIEYHPSTSMDVSNGVGFAETIKVSRKNDGALLRQRFATYHKNKLSTITTKLNDTETSTVNLGYDAYGNLEESTSPGGFKTFLEYDEKVHSYPVSVSNSYGEIATTDYDYAFGVPTFVKDANGQEMRTRIDNRGRLVEVTAPNEMETTNGWTLRMQYQGEDAVPPAFNENNYVVPAQGSFSWDTAASQTESDAKHHAVTHHYVEDAHQNQLLTVSLMDGMGKAIQLKKTLYANSNASTPLRWLISGKKERDVFGRVLKNYLPTTSTGYPQDPNNLSATVFDYESGTYPSTIDPTIMEYDAKDRVVSINQPGPTEPGENELAIIEYGIEDGMFKTSSTNELDQTMDTYTDAKGRQRKTIQNGELTTEFHYNAIGEKTRVKNHQGYETFYVSDMAGRRLSEKHPDKGLCLYTYDTSGNLVSKQTSNLISGEPQSTINYIYDDYKRRLTETTYPLNSENNVTYAYGASNSLEAKAVNAVGRLFMQTDATGVQGFGYDKLGNLTTHLRGVAAAGKQTFWFNTKWEYDSHNRIKNIIYPDNETVTYNYNQGGNLDNIYRTISSFEKGDIVTKIKYNDLGERTSIEYGNGTMTEYTYDARRRLNDLKHQFIGFEVTNRYAYDALNNVKSLTTQNPNNSLSTSGQLGGPIQHNYQYDDYNRLVHADGRYTGPNDYESSLLAQEYNLDMTYDLAHNITSKTQTHVQGAVSNHSNPIATPETMVKTNYHLAFGGYATGNQVVQNQSESFGYVQPHAPREIIETPDATAIDGTDPRYKKKRIAYDANGNQIEIKQVVFEGEQGAATNGVVEQKEITLLKNLWDEENRLRAVDTNPEETSAHPIAIYTYDASGERTVRYVPGRVDVKSNATTVSLNERDETILYPSGMLTAKAQGVPTNPDNKGIASYTKHYYMGSERIHSTLGTATNLGLFPSSMNNKFPSIRTLANSSVQEATTGVLQTYTALNQNVSLPTPIIEGELTRYAHDKTKYNAYWYHRDHLGSSSYITNLKGVVSQHMEYLPYGELLVDEHKNSYNVPYKFNAKELDEETGNYYYGARYYNPKFSIWLGVDPLAEQMPEWSSYNYTFSNPIKYSDPTGLAPENNVVSGPGCTICPNNKLLELAASINPPVSSEFNSQLDYVFVINQEEEIVIKAKSKKDIFIDVVKKHHEEIESQLINREKRRLVKRLNTFLRVGSKVVAAVTNNFNGLIHEGADARKADFMKHKVFTVGIELDEDLNIVTSPFREIGAGDFEGEGKKLIKDVISINPLSPKLGKGKKLDDLAKKLFKPLLKKVIESIPSSSKSE